MNIMSIIRNNKLSTARRKQKLLEKVIMYGLDIQKYCKWMDLKWVSPN